MIKLVDIHASKSAISNHFECLLGPEDKERAIKALENVDPSKMGEAVMDLVSSSEKVKKPLMIAGLSCLVRKMIDKE